MPQCLPSRAAAFHTGVALAVALHTTPAAGGTGFFLPAEERVGDWRDPLVLAGMQAVPDMVDARIVLLPQEDRWTLRVTDDAGQLHELQVPRPVSSEQREQIVWLASSLLHPMEDAWGDLAPAPFRGIPKPALPAPPAPRFALPAPSVPDPPPPVVVIPIEPVALADPPPPAAPEPERLLEPLAGVDSDPHPPASVPPEPWCSADFGISARRTLQPATVLGLSAGLLLGERRDVAVTLRPRGAADLTDLGANRQLRSWDLILAVAGRFGGDQAARTGVSLGVSRRRYLQAAQEVAGGWVPLAGLVGEYRLAEAGPITGSAWLRATVDLRQTELCIEDETWGLLPPAVLELGLAAAFKP